jgi:uncharacterized protein YdbL (DUF1318 family)
MKVLAVLIAASCALAAAPAVAQSPAIAQAIEAGQVGEKFDGYMGFVGAPSPDLRRQVAAVNLRRRNLYIDLSTRRNVSPQLVGMATACQLLSQLSVGEPYMLSDGVWRRRAAGQAIALPDYCQ